MPLALTVGQKVGLAVVAAIFIGFAVASAWALPRRNPDFPGPRGVRWFAAASLLLMVAMLTAMVVFAREDTEQDEHGEEHAAAVHRAA